MGVTRHGSLIVKGGGVVPNYQAATMLIKQFKDSETAYLTIDFPKGNDMEDDFIAVFVVNCKNLTCTLMAIPYDKVTGEKKIPILETQSKLLTEIKNQFNHILSL